MGDLGVEKVLKDLSFWCNKSGENCLFCKEMSEVIYKMALEDSFDSFVKRSVSGASRKDGEVIQYIRCYYFGNYQQIAEFVVAWNDSSIIELVFALEDMALRSVLEEYCATEKGDLNLAIARWWVEYLRDVKAESDVSFLTRLQEKYKSDIERLKVILKD